MTVIVNQNPKKKLKRQKATRGAGFIIEGGHPLKGKVYLGGAKNASLKLMAASLLADKGPVKLFGLPQIGDVSNTAQIIEKIGARVKKLGAETFLIEASEMSSFKLPQELALKTRAPIMFAGPLLSRFCKAVLPFPGGDCLGQRPLNRHFKALKSLGVKIRTFNNHFTVSCKKLKATEFTFSKTTHTGTEVLLMAAVKAQGRTVIKNAALEPEVDDLIMFLNKMGAKIKRAGEGKIIIKGVKELKGVEYQVMPDRNEAVTFACVALGTKGDIIVENAQAEQLKAFLAKLKEIGAGVEKEKSRIRFFYNQKLEAVKVKTAPHPGFMTDWQPLWTTLMTQAQGESQVTETVFPNRFSYVSELKKMGAKINLFNPEVANPEEFYNFNLEELGKGYHAAKILGPTKLTPIKARVANLRAGATLVLAALMAKGKSVLDNITEIDRGYEKLEEKLVRLGAKIERV